jgi:hypothetical protein
LQVVKLLYSSGKLVVVDRTGVEEKLASASRTCTVLILVWVKLIMDPCDSTKLVEIVAACAGLDD